jgi:hypothetical protein
MMLPTILFSVLLLLSQTRRAVDVTPGSKILAYAMDYSCPPNWADLTQDPAYQGRLIKGWNNANGLGATRGAPSTTNSVPLHVHSSWSRRLVIGGSKRTSILNKSGYKMLDNIDDFYIDQTMGFMTDGGINAGSMRSELDDSNMN